jgi:hypothetical protein
VRDLRFGCASDESETSEKNVHAIEQLQAFVANVPDQCDAHRRFRFAAALALVRRLFAKELHRYLKVIVHGAPT